MTGIRIRNPDYQATDKHFGDPEPKIIVTTPGRVRFNEIWPKDLGFINFNVGKKQVGDIIWRCYQCAGQAATVIVLDELKTLGFKEAMRSGISIGIIDMVVPEEKGPELEKAYTEVEKVTKQYRNGVITDNERYQQGDRYLDTCFR